LARPGSLPRPFALQRIELKNEKAEKIECGIAAVYTSLPRANPRYVYLM
jgi:hypothetical protein